jgi:group I intron endonuclease
MKSTKFVQSATVNKFKADAESFIATDVVEQIKVLESRIFVSNNEVLSQLGVYAIKHIPSGKLYVGSTNQSFRRRWREHLRNLQAGHHHSPQLQRAWNKYGCSEFDFIVLELLSKGKQGVISAEQKWMSLYKSYLPKKGYNVLHKAGSPERLQHSEEAKIKIRNALKGRTHTVESKEKIRNALTGRKRPIELCKKFSEQRKGIKPKGFVSNPGDRSKLVKRLDTQEIYPSATAAAKSLNLNPGAVSNSIFRKRRCGGTYWEYVNE